MVNVINFFSFTKSIALLIIIVSGFVWMGQGRTENLHDLFENTSDSPGNYALAFYAVSINIKYNMLGLVWFGLARLS